MHVPQAVCRQLYRLNKQLRFAWFGAERPVDSEELNCGDFAIVQLYHISDAGTPDEPNTFFQRWEREYGPIWSKDGRGLTDWDPLFRVPILVARCGDFGVTKSDVLSGAVIPVVEEWYRRTRTKAAALERKRMGRELASRLDDVADGITDNLWSLGSKSGESGVSATWEDRRAELARLEVQRHNSRQRLLHYYDTVGM